MKLKTPLLLVLFALFSCCIFHKKPDYTIPDSVTKEDRAALIANIEKGKTTYVQYCSGCHAISGKGEKGVPAFSTREIHNYSERYLTNDLKNHSVVLKMDAGILDDALTYLRYKVLARKGKDIPGGL